MSTSAAPLSRLRRLAGHLHWLLRSKLVLTLLLACSSTQASVGLDTIEPASRAGPITVFYPSDAPISEVKRGSFVLNVAWKGRPIAGNRRLIVISHGLRRIALAAERPGAHAGGSRLRRRTARTRW